MMRRMLGTPSLGAGSASKGGPPAEWTPRARPCSAFLGGAGRSGLLCSLLLLAAIGSACADDPLDRKVVCTYHDREFSEVAADLGKQAGMEMLIDPTIKERVSLDLGNVTLGDALTATCDLAGVFYGRASDKSIAIAPADPKRPLFPLIVETKVLPIRYVTTKQLLNLMAVSPYRELIAADEVSNQVRIIGPRPALDKIEAEIAQIDRPKAQISAADGVPGHFADQPEGLEQRLAGGRQSVK